MAKAKDALIESSRPRNGDRFSNLGEIIGAAKKKYKSPLVRGVSGRVVPRIRTGVFGIDYHSFGGLPIGRISMVFGEKSTGKTTFYMRALANAQRICAGCYRPAKLVDGVISMPSFPSGRMKDVETKVVECDCGNPRDFMAVWIDSEGAFDADWAKRFGVLTEKIYFCRPEYGEQGYDIAYALVNSGEVDLCVVDSIAQMTPIDELDASIEKQHQAIGARMNNKFMRKIVSALNRGWINNREISVWLVNQYRMAIGVMYGDPRVLTGGKGQGFVTSLEIEMSSGKPNVSDDGDVLSTLFKWKIKKGRICPSGTSGEFEMLQDKNHLGEINEIEQVLKLSIDAGLIEKPNMRTYVFNGETYSGKDELLTYLKTNNDSFEALKEDILDCRL